MAGGASSQAVTIPEYLMLLALLVAFWPARKAQPMPITKLASDLVAGDTVIDRLGDDDLDIFTLESVGTPSETGRMICWAVGDKLPVYFDAAETVEVSA